MRRGLATRKDAVRLTADGGEGELAAGVVQTDFLGMVWRPPRGWSFRRRAGWGTTWSGWVGRPGSRCQWRSLVFLLPRTNVVNRPLEVLAPQAVRDLREITKPWWRDEFSSGLTQRRKTDERPVYKSSLWTICRRVIVNRNEFDISSARRLRRIGLWRYPSPREQRNTLRATVTGPAYQECQSILYLENTWLLLEISCPRYMAP
jgi:hypothetical protein